ncbi:MAG TPA: ATP-binding protein [Candidatus Dormibacteraeota bacterium]|nr:ATP-binding protein [Candidatus Dormibacteraeota bacterium]
MENRRIPLEKLRRRLDPATLRFSTTAEVAPARGPFNQARAMDALRFGVGIDSPGYNFFASGQSGSGRTSMVRSFLETLAAGRPVPDDWIYVHDFDHPDNPKALRLPAGKGRQLASDMESFIDQSRQQITHAFDTERYMERHQQLATEIGQRRDRILGELDAFARERSFGIEVTPAGIIAVPVHGGKAVPADELQRLPESERNDLERRGTEVQTEIGVIMRRLGQLEREGADLLLQLDREIARFAIEPLLHALRERYVEEPEVIAHLERIAKDIPDHLPDFRQSAAGQESPSALGAALSSDHTDRYRINVLVDNSTATGVPVVVESNPTYYNLMGRVEYRATFGMMVTDFRQIKAGALHRANGGFLILDAADVLTNPFAWPALMRALSTQRLRIENLGEQYSAVPTASLSPAPVPIKVKVVLVGSQVLYQMLFALDEEFRELFKVRVDFAPEVEWTEETVAEYSGFVSRCVHDRGLKHFDRTGVARVIEETARWRESQRKVSTRLRDLDDLVTESSYWAAQASHELVQREDVARAVTEKARRSSLTEERLRELIAQGTIRIEIGGSRMGQLNGLSVIELGDHRFGVPSRISATVAMGRGSVESIDREVKMGGPIHNKGFLIVSGYLAAHYAQRWPLAMRATLTFEQSYDEVEGDSASSAELYALLSALSEVPLKQNIAVTGSVDQHGNVQAVGGVTDKIEGFFKVCRSIGLTGEQGVIIPMANVADLMLDDEVIDAVRAGKFSVWAVESVDEGIEILTGVEAGQPGAGGTYPAQSIHDLVARRLQGYANLQAAFGAPTNGEAVVAQPVAKAKT